MSMITYQWKFFSELKAMLMSEPDLKGGAGTNIFKRGWAKSKGGLNHNT